MKRFLRKAAASAAFVFSAINAIELPVRYKVGALNVTQRKSIDNWVSNVGLRYSSVSTREGLDMNSQRTSALDVFGQTNLVRLGFGLENLARMPNTSGFWGLGYAAAPGAAGRQVLDDAGQNLVKITGRVAASEFVLDLDQNLFSGFFAQCHVPFRQLTIDNLGYEVTGSQNLPGGAGVSNFVEMDLPRIMREQGMEAPLTVYRKQAVSEIVAGLGWQGFNNKGFGVIQDATGRVFVGAIIPGGGKQDFSYLAGLPLGYDGFFGVHTRIELEVGMQKYFALGAASSVNIFFQDTRTRRVMSDAEKQQQGVLSFVQARVGVDQGAVWDISAYAKLHKIFYGLVATVGYSFSRQEETRLTVKDEEYLKSAVNRYLQQVPPRFLNQNDVANTDQRLRSWERQMLHLGIGYDFRLHASAPAVAPAISFEYAYPIEGRRVMLGKYLGGSASLQLKMPF